MSSRYDDGVLLIVSMAVAQPLYWVRRAWDPGDIQSACAHRSDHLGGPHARTVPAPVRAGARRMRVRAAVSRRRMCHQRTL